MENITFEQAMNRLEEIVSALENNQISLEKSVELFQEGIQLTKLCNDKLEGIENKVAKQDQAFDTLYNDLLLEMARNQIFLINELCFQFYAADGARWHRNRAVPH